MSQAVTDLPDPLQPLPALAASSPDDLLSKMADEAIDKLMADADKGSATQSGTPLVPMTSVASDPEALPAHTPAETVPDASISSPDVMTPAIAEAIAATEAPHAVDAAHATAAKTTTHHEAVAAAVPDGPAFDKRALLEDVPAKASPLLLPLRMLNAPLANVSEATRRFVGLLGIVTLVPAICAIVYVVFLKHR